MRTLPAPIVIGFAEDGNKNPIPVPSQIGILNGAASFTDGFPPLTMTPLVEGGVPPAGLDFNGILFMLSDYCAWLQGGGAFQFDANYVTANTGYAAGAILQSATDPTRFYLCTVDDNANDPDVDSTGWLQYSPVATPTGAQSETLAAGSQVVALDPGAGFLDCDTTAGAASISNLTGASDGQIVTVSNQGPNALTLLAGLFRMSSNLTILADDSATVRYSAALAVWVLV